MFTRQQTLSDIFKMFFIQFPITQATRSNSAKLRHCSCIPIYCNLLNASHDLLLLWNLLSMSRNNDRSVFVVIFANSHEASYHKGLIIRPKSLITLFIALREKGCLLFMSWTAESFLQVHDCEVCILFI